MRSATTKFWHPPLWKWGVSVGLVIFSIFLGFWWRPGPVLKPASPVKVELLPFSDSPPAWDGAYPYLVISPIPKSGPVKFKTAISFIKPTVRHDSPVNQFEVDLHSGRFVMRQTDLLVPDVQPLSLTRTYISWDYHSRAFGVAANHPYDICPTGTSWPYTYMDVNLEDFYQVHMPRISKGAGFADAVFRHDKTSSEFYGAQVAWNGNGWTLTFRDGRKILFPDSYHAKTYAQGAAIEMVDADGHRIQLKRNKARNLEELLSPSGHAITFKYDLADRIVEASDDAGNMRRYSYDSSGHLETVSNGSKILYRFEYQRLLNEAGYDPWLLTAVLDGDWNVIVRNKFLWGRVSEQKLADGEVYRYEYRLRERDVIQCAVTLPSGQKKLFDFQDGILIYRK